MNQKKKPKQVGMMVYSMANFNFTWGLEMPCLVQHEEPHMESGLVQIFWAFNSLHTNEVASSRLQASMVFTNQSSYSFIRSELPGTKKRNKEGDNIWRQ